MAEAERPPKDNLSCEEIVLEIFRQLEDAPTCFFCGEADGHKPGCIGAGIEGMVK